MVDNQIRTFDVTDQRVLAAIEAVPRELFVSERLVDLAYSDAVLTVVVDDAKRSLCAPMVLARMFQGLELESGDRTLIIAAGTGYAAAVAAELCAFVVALESESAFVTATEAHAARLGLSGVHAVLGPLDRGHDADGPYTAIMVCGAVETDLSSVLAQLAPGGRLVTIRTASHEATRRSGKVVRYDRIGNDVSSRVLFDATAPVLDAFRLDPAFTF